MAQLLGVLRGFTHVDPFEDTERWRHRRRAATRR